MQSVPSQLAGGHRVRKCGTCRDRRVKCDNTKPLCVTCTSRGIECQGYLPPNGWISVEPGRKNSRASSRKSKGSSTGYQNRRRTLVAVAPQPRPNSISTLNPDPVSSSRQYFLLRLAGNATRSSSSGLPNLLCRFLDRPLPVESMQYKCMKALTGSYYLMRRGGPRACLQVREAYVHALNAVNAGIGAYSRIGSDVLMSIMCLCLYENIIVTEPRSWIKHYKGISRMIEIHGPGHYQTVSNREILLAFRYTIIISAGTLRQPCFLAEPAWRNVIQLNEAESRDVYDTLLNVAVDVPGLLYGSDRLTDGQLSGPELASLSITLQWAMRELEVWWCASFSDASVTNNSSSIYSPLNASAIAFHHMVLLLLEDLCYNLNVPWRPTSILFPPATGFSNDVPIMDIVMRAQQRHIIASEILYLAQHSICPDTGMYGTLRFVMPLHVAHDYLIPASPERHDLHNLMNTVVAKQHGFHMAKRYDGQYTSFRESLSDYQDSS